MEHKKIVVKEIYFEDKPGMDMEGFTTPGNIVFILADGQEVFICAENYKKMKCPICGQLTTDNVLSGGNRRCRDCYDEYGFKEKKDCKKNSYNGICYNCNNGFMTYNEQRSSECPICGSNNTD